MYETHTIVDSEQSLLTKMNLHFLSGHLRRHNIHLKYQNPETKPNKIPMRFTYLFRYKSPLHRLIARKVEGRVLLAFIFALQNTMS